MNPSYAPFAERAIRHLTLVAIAMIVLLVGVLGGLAATIRLQGAVIAAGTLVVDTYVKPVQHQKGGTVGQVFVKNGDRVESGQILVHLDDTQTRANLAIVSKRLKELAARTARLSAERDAKETITFPETLLKDREIAEVGAMLDGEQRLFQDRRSSRTGRKGQLAERVSQLSKEAEGLDAQQDGKRQAIFIINKELASLQPLLDQGIIPATRVYALQRDAADLTGELGSLVASAAQTNGKIAETRLQIIQVDDDQRTEVSDQLRQAESESGEYSERLVAAEDELKHIDIRAPQAGIVHQLVVHAPGAVVTPGEAIMQIVPDTDALTPELKLSPQDIDQVAVGQEVTLRFSAFSQRTTPELNGRVTKIAADLTTDQRTGQSYYSLRVGVPEAEWKRLGSLSPVAGMPVEAFVQTGERTALAYLAKPLTDQIARAFKEE
ncbi:HlyD family secretion protein [Rhizobium leguminosarum]|uniref:Membrane fusion protein (MFP) family protein n=1 Tax=Rhizobium leguminosarum TaxID=384 RepID=A0AAE2MIP4_RHILE|nr:MULTISPECIES: HlyD family type I secretion periplasmic adaptor subunit [Rhizobium]MBB4290283.1 HlyD family secretion protein [Rhizobium leguminosarum]MBB4296926.1 HlyD family secretion protein [Rhizobium leguminosarum]MBB4307812.1 HlyD family secretion protein [Rhizobium leguminosarum]MBB4415648.1 HlyD family secretion protein [Rhizobium leguminosarum]MBB4431386.1 HlyD family secretion protein [Rhizobium esperanzae]